MPDTSSPSVRARLRSLANQLPYVPRALALVWESARPWTIAWVVLLVIQGLLPVAVVYLTKQVVDSLVAVVDSAGAAASVQAAVVWVLLMALVLLLSQSLSAVSAWVQTALSELATDQILTRVHTQAIRLDLGFYETTDYYDKLHRARVDALTRPLAILQNLGSLMQSTITLVALLAILLAYSVWLPLLIMLGTLPAFYVSIAYTKRYHAWRLRNTGNERRTRYYDWMITWHEAAAELRLFGLGPTFQQAYRDVRKKLREENLRLVRSQTLAQIGAGIAALITMGLAMIWMVVQAMRGLASLGDLAAFYQIINQGQTVVRTLFSSAGDTYRNMLFLENLFEFLELEPAINDPAGRQPAPFALQREILFEDVTFRYPGSERAALDHFHLTIPAGKITAIVGENGAGKSTLIKLMCRFYDPEQGIVAFDGVDVRDLALADLRHNITVLFQQPVHYHDTAGYNVAAGDLASAASARAIEAAARAAGAHEPISKLPDGYETILGRWFGGSELSVGEWQRVALARAFLRQASLIILDEPTSAMDSWAEADWMARFRELVVGRTAVLITHRFTTAMRADIIHVMGDGRILEAGAHADLLARGGRYAQSWRLQMQAPTNGEQSDSTCLIVDEVL